MKKALVIMAALALPTAGVALDWAGRLGFTWTRQDDWLVDVHNQSPVTDIDLDLRFRQVVQRPEIAWVRGGVGFRLYDRQTNGITAQRSDTYTYSLAGALLESRSSPFILNAQAARVVADLSGAGGQWFGSRTSDSGSVVARVGVPEYPGATVGYAWNLAKDEIPTLPDHHRDLQRLDASVRHGSPAFNFNAGYSGEWSKGSWLGEDYQSNTVLVDANARLGGATTFTLSDQYYQRSPTATFDAALASELHYLQAGIQNATSPQQGQSGRYVYSHASNAAPVFGRTVSTSQALEYWREFRFDDSEFSARTTGSASMVDQALNGTSIQTSGETLGLLGRWHHQSTGTTNDIQAGPSVALLQNASGGNDIGYGANASLSTTRPAWGFSATGRYDASYGNNVGGVEGWYFRHSLSGSGQGPLGRGTLAASLQLQSTRGWSPLFGASAGRNVYATTSYAIDRTQLRASLTVGSGIAGSPGDKFVGDGLLLPAPFNSHAVFASASATTATAYGVTATAGLRFGDTNVPGQPAMTQYGADAGLGYSFAAFTVALEDRVTTYEYPSGRVTTNVVFVRLYRAIGDSF